MTLPASCAAILPTVTRDLGVSTQTIVAEDETATTLECHFYDSAAAENNGGGYISVSWSVMDTAQMASLTFGTVTGMTFGNSKTSTVTGLGDKAVAVTFQDVVSQVAVLAGSSILTVSQLQYGTPIELSKWTALAKDLLAGAA